jgi:hypothetical protein
LTWLRASGLVKAGDDSPLFPAADGGVASKAAVVSTFEALGLAIGQPTHSATGIRLFGGHTPRVTGAQALAAAGVEVNKIRILARHSGDTILRYVADAPLMSLRADLSAAASRTGLSSMTAARVATVDRARLVTLETSLATLERNLQSQAQDLVALATGFARTDSRVFVQNSITAVVHLALALDGGHSACGWRFATARGRGTNPAYRVITSLTNLPGEMICERCMPTEKAVPLGSAHSGDCELSGDDSLKSSHAYSCFKCVKYFLGFGNDYSVRLYLGSSRSPERLTQVLVLVVVINTRPLNGIH